jgi:hypothetical protein
VSIEWSARASLGEYVLEEANLPPLTMSGAVGIEAGYPTSIKKNGFRKVKGTKSPTHRKDCHDENINK